jgi:hypothetical protein
MGGPHQQNRRMPDDSYAKIKFSIPSFLGHYDAVGYLDWEMMVEQKFSAHLVPKQHRVRQATSEFKDFAIIWCNGLASQGALPGTWEQLKVVMRDCFVPPSYHRDLRKKLQRLEQGEKSIQDYYGELQKGLMRCSIVEGTEDSICRFYLGLNHEIQDIVDYNEFNTVNQLFQFAMLTEKELQVCVVQRNRNNLSSSFAPRSATMTGSTKTSSSRTTPPASTHSTSSTATPATSPSPSAAEKGKNVVQALSKNSSSGGSKGRSGL